MEASWSVPGQRGWRARRVKRQGRKSAVSARHRVLFWRAITVETQDLRFGAEAIARYLQGAHVGYPVHDSRGRLRERLRARRIQRQIQQIRSL